MNWVINLACKNGNYLQNQLRNLSLILWNLFLAEPIFKKGSLKLFGTEPTFRYRKILKFQVLHLYWIQPLWCIAKLHKAYLIYFVPTEGFNIMAYKKSSSNFTVTCSFETCTFLTRIFRSGLLSQSSIKIIYSIHAFYWEISNFCDTKEISIV